MKKEEEGPPGHAHKQLQRKAPSHVQSALCMHGSTGSPTPSIKAYWSSTKTPLNTLYSTKTPFDTLYSTKTPLNTLEITKTQPRLLERAYRCGLCTTVLVGLQVAQTATSVRLAWRVPDPPDAAVPAQLFLLAAPFQ